MNKSKSFTQYKDDSFLISLKIGMNGNIRLKSVLNFYGNISRNKSKQWGK